MPNCCAGARSDSCKQMKVGEDLHRSVVEGCWSTHTFEHMARAGFPGIVKVGSHLVGRLEELGPQAVVDVDEALSRESLDVIGTQGS